MLYSPIVHRSNSGCPENPFRKENQNCNMYIWLIMHEHIIDDRRLSASPNYLQDLQRFKTT